MNNSFIFSNGTLFVQKGLFSPATVFDCGQSFRFFAVERDSVPGFEGVASGKFARVEEDENSIRIKDIKEEDVPFWINYFALSDDYCKIREDILKNSEKYRGFMEKASDWGAGIRILHQDSWEAIATFIISQNNNIPRITKIVRTLSEMFGDEIKTPYGTEFAFPSPEALFEAGTEKIALTRCGFRAKYLFDAAEKIVKKEIDLSAVPQMKTEEAIDYLCRIKGVGVKVASCALLFGFSKYDAFPIDTWMKKVIAERFDSDMPDFGEYKGIAQQYLFYYERYNGDQDGKSIAGA